LKATASPTPGADDRWIKDHLPLSASCAMDEGLAVISALLQAFPGDVRKKDGFPAAHVAKSRASSVSASELLGAAQFDRKCRQDCLEQIMSNHKPIQQTQSRYQRHTDVPMVLRQHTSIKLERIVLQHQSILVPPKSTVRVGKIVHCLA
jgi:hypothetical protein